MKHTTVFAVVLLLAAFLCCTVKLTAQIQNEFELYAGHAFKVSTVEPFFFEGFGKGISNDLPITERARYCRLVKNLKPNQKLFIEPSTDRTEWERHKYSYKDDHRMDASVGFGRGVWAIDTARSLGHEAVLMTPKLNETFRGFTAYVVTYSPIPQPKPEPLVVTKESTIVIIREENNNSWFSKLRFGIGVGGTYLNTHGMQFAVPNVSLILKMDKSWYLTLSGGLIQAKSNDRFGDRAEMITSADLAYYPHAGWFGWSIGVQGAWENVLEKDEFLNRAYGIKTGPRIRFWQIQLGCDLQISNHSEYGNPNSWWGLGFSPNAKLIYVW